jgi:hypothetical protein
MKTTLSYLFLLLIFTEASSQVRIASFSPAAAVKGAAVKITGADFNPSPDSNIVYFGACRAKVNIATPTFLNVTVPAGASCDYITVTDLSTNLTAWSSEKFNLTFPWCGTVNATSFETPAIHYSAFLYHLPSFTGPSQFKSASIKDLDGDGKPDIAIAGSDLAALTVLRNNNNPGYVTGFQNRSDIYVRKSKEYPLQVLAGDIDGDGKPELLLSKADSNLFMVFKNNCSPGTISFSLPTRFNTGDSAVSLAIGDLNMDGKTDVAVTDYNDNTVSVFKNISTGGNILFGSAVKFTTGDKPVSVSIGDLDGDRRPDLIISNQGSKTLSAFRNTSIPGTISFAARIDIPSIFAYNTALGDLDGDGRMDLVAVNKPDTLVSVFMNTGTVGNISFATRLNLRANFSPEWVVLSDLDGDGKADISVTETNSGNAASVSIFPNLSSTGNFSFGQRVNIVNPSYLTLAMTNNDLDGDGRTDMLNVDDGSSISLFRNKSCSGPCVNSASTINEVYCISYESPSGKYIWTQSGTYSDTIPNAAGCDSFMTFNIIIDTVNTGVTQNGDTLIADAANAVYQWIRCSDKTIIQGETNSSFIPQFNGRYAVVVTQNGCSDTSVCYNITGRPCTNSQSLNTVVACKSYLSPSGKTIWKNAGLYADTIPNAAGCDSIILIHLTIYKPYYDVHQDGRRLYVNQNPAYFYQWMDCNSNSIINKETNASFTAMTNGSYAIIVKDGSCIDTSSCYIISNVGVEENSHVAGLKIYPNPSSGSFTIDVKNPPGSGCKLQITDMPGRTVMSSTVTSPGMVIKVNSLQAGIYFVRLISENGSTFCEKIVVH